MESYGSTRMRPMNHGPTHGTRRAVIPGVESEYERLNCISDMHQFEVKVQQLMGTETSAENTACEFGLFLFCSCVSNEQQGPMQVICQTIFGISDDLDLSSESGNVTVQSCSNVHQTGPSVPVLPALATPVDVSKARLVLRRLFLW